MKEKILKYLQYRWDHYKEFYSIESFKEYARGYCEENGYDQVVICINGNSINIVDWLVGNLNFAV